ncbi:flavin reductase [Pseudomonas gingeri]|uniref:flavin reductase family protein n=1 Tax=Pseudomonas gingeri TaxID=117681 RepID=UPI0015A32041|nr:flavin reductase family protein [Pseudomonas gingeri]NWA24893.1 flavin reductase [Pseudomonas gingeri]
MPSSMVNTHLAAVDPGALRQAFGTFVTGVTVITTHDAEGNPRGMTANSFTSVSLDPPLLLVCVGKSAASYSAFAGTEHFAVNLLHEGQVDVSGTFASKSPDKFHTVNHDKVHTGAPILTDSLTWFDCTVDQRIEAGDHLVLIGQVRAFGTSPKLPLCFCRGRYANIQDPLPASWLDSHKMIIGYLIEAGDAILFRADGAGGWTLPVAGKRKGFIDVGQNALSIELESTFLYSVFDVDDTDPGYLIYRAQLDPLQGPFELPETLRFFPLDELPIEQMPVNELRSVVRRYARERKNQQFGIYTGSAESGRVEMIENAALAHECL